jgi:hypothetical protein
VTLYLKCPNGCTGEVPLEPEATDNGGSPDVPGSMYSYYVAFVDSEANATSHDDGCPPLTPEQIDALEQEGTDKLADPSYGYWDVEP